MVLITKFSQINASFTAKLSVVTESANVSVLRALLGCISALLRVQPASVWSLHEKKKVTDLLSFTCLNGDTSQHRGGSGRDKLSWYGVTVTFTADTVQVSRCDD